MCLFAISAGRDGLDFNAPSQPTEADLTGMISHAERLLGSLRALRELVPEILEDDELDEGRSGELTGDELDYIIESLSDRPYSLHELRVDADVAHALADYGLVVIDLGNPTVLRLPGDDRPWPGRAQRAQRDSSAAAPSVAAP